MLERCTQPAALVRRRLRVPPSRGRHRACRGGKRTERDVRATALANATTSATYGADIEDPATDFEP